MFSLCSKNKQCNFIWVLKWLNRLQNFSFYTKKKVKVYEVCNTCNLISLEVTLINLKGYIFVEKVKNTMLLECWSEWKDYKILTLRTKLT